MSEFRSRLEALSREDLLELLQEQDPELFKQVRRIEWVFSNKLSHLTWDDGTPITSRPLTNQELALLIDEPFAPNEELTKLGVSIEQQRQFHIASDTVLWAKHFLEVKLRAYQELVLRCSSNRLVMRFGRRCLVGNTPILMADGSWKEIQNINKGEFIAARKDPGNFLVRQKVTDHWSNGTQKVYKITLSNRLEIECTSNHPFLTKVFSGTTFGPKGGPRSKKKAWLSIDEGLKEGMDVHVLNEYIKFGDLYRPSEAKMLGYLVTDGYIAGSSEKCSSQTPKFTSNDLVYLEEVQKLAKELFDYDCQIKPRIVSEASDVYITDGDHGTHNRCKEWIRDYGLLGTKCKTKHLPNEFWQWDEESVALFINRVFSGDGCSSTWDSKGRNGAGELSIASAAPELLDDIRLVLLKFGVNGLVREETTRPGNYKLKISDKNSILNFFDHCGLIYGKEEQSLRMIESAKRRLFGYSKGNTNFRLVKIRKIEFIGEKETYDITVDNYRNFIANGIVVSNSGKTFTLAIKMLHYAFTHNHGRVIVVAPMKAHVELIYKEVLKLASKSDMVNSSITRKPQSPQFSIEFSNGSSIKFFTSGMRSGGRADIVRGQEAHIIILDELDYMHSDDLESLYAMLQKTAEDQEDKIMIGASTPTGRREHFWNFCHSPYFREFWFPSYTSPFFTKEVEAEFRTQYTEMAYRHEIEADWGEDAQGVYLRKYVDAAFVTPAWEYRAEKTIDHSFYVMGVDWDKFGAGVNIVVLELCGLDYTNPAFQNKIRVIYRQETKKEEFTYTKAVNRIVELNDIFEPRHIYIDRGVGEVQQELLHQYGIDHPDSGLRQTVKGVSFSETFEMRDPASKELVKKEIKPFMVDNLSQMLEQGKILFPAHDQELYMQLISYIVVRTTVSGRPIFEASGSQVDHAHDALILACLSITQNYGKLMNQNYAVHSRAVSNQSFLPILEITQDNQEKIEEQFDSHNEAPVMQQRAFTAAKSRKNPSRPIRRKIF